jgi:hypothetical protein
MWLFRILAFTAALWLSAACAEPIVDLTAPQKETPSVLDLSGGNPANWETRTDGDYIPLVGGSGGSGGSGYNEPRLKTQFVSGYTRKDGVQVRAYVRSSRR